MNKDNIRLLREINNQVVRKDLKLNEGSCGGRRHSENEELSGMLSIDEIGRLTDALEHIATVRGITDIDELYNELYDMLDNIAGLEDPLDKDEAANIVMAQYTGRTM